jgi:hypothetical protein
MSITKDQIQQLRTEAAAAGDEAQVRLCDSALMATTTRGTAWRKCVEAITGEPSGWRGYVTTEGGSLYGKTRVRARRIDAEREAIKLGAECERVCCPIRGWTIEPVWA